MIRFDDVSMRYAREQEPALREVSLEITRGEFALIVGSSGSGKSSLLKLITREELADSGTLMVAGRDLRRLPARKVPALRREIGVVFQDFRLLEDKTVRQNVAFALQVRGRRRHEISQLVPEVLDRVGLSGMQSRLPHQLSGGEQQRLAIARAVVNRPAIVVADEPTGNLDPDASAEIIQVLDRVNRAGTTVVVATHDHLVVEQLGKRVVELDAGQVVRDDERAGYAPSHEWASGQ